MICFCYHFARFCKKNASVTHCAWERSAKNATNKGQSTCSLTIGGTIETIVGHHTDSWKHHDGGATSHCFRVFLAIVIHCLALLACETIGNLRKTTNGHVGRT